MQTPLDSPLIIADSSGLVSLAVATDSNHERALAISQALNADQRTILVPSDVFTETLNVLGRHSGHTAALQTAGILRDSRIFHVVETGDQLVPALDLFSRQPDSVSFTDCMVMACADAWETREIFGFDAVFRKNGYQLPGASEVRRAA